VDVIGTLPGACGHTKAASGFAAAVASPLNITHKPATGFTPAARDPGIAAVQARFGGVLAPGGTITGMSIAKIRTFLGVTVAGASLALTGATGAVAVGPAAAAVSPVLGHWAKAAAVTLKRGKATWTFPPKKLRPGTYQLTATYTSSNAYDPATTATKKFVVTK
jgi:hypothetical protein